MEFKLVFHKKVLSTSIEAKKIKGEENLWTVIASESQEAGHGKKKRGWFSPAGGLYFSIVINPRSLEDSQLLTLAAGLATVKVLRKKFEVRACLKWPNDVLIKGKKVSGALVENVVGDKVKSTVIGIGINTNIAEFPASLVETATSLERELKKKIDNQGLLKEILEELAKTLESERSAILKEYRLYEETIGREIKILTKGKEVFGQAVDFDQRGDLIVKLKNNKTVKILEGDISYNFK